MTTKKEVLIKKYIAYQYQVKQITNCNILPSLEDYDILEEELYQTRAELEVTTTKLKELETRQAKLDNLLSIADVADLVIEF